MMIRKINKKIIISLLIILALSISYAVYASGLLLEQNNNDLVLDIDLALDNYEPSNRTFSDSSGVGSDAIAASAAVFSGDYNNKDEGAIDLNGTNNFVTVGTSGSLGVTTDISVFAWIKVPSSYPAGSRVGNIIGNYPYTPVFNLEGHTSGRLRVWWNGERDIYSTGFDMRDDAWHLVGFVRNLNSNVIQMYIDGVPNTSTTAATSFNFQYPFKVGDDFRSGVNPGIPFSGSIANVKIYNRALSANEVSSLYSAGKPKLTTSSIESGLVGHWTLDGNDYNATTNRLTDKTPYENHATNYGATLTTDRNGQSNGAMSFNGTSYINGGNDSSLMPASISVSAWLKLTDTSSWMVVNKQTGGISGSYYIYGGSNTSCIWSIFGPTATRYDVSMGGLNLNEWYHLVGTFDSTTRLMKGYKNGVLIGTRSNAELGSNAASLLIGKYTSGYNVDGGIDDVRIYNRALSDDEVNTLYNSYAPQSSASSLQQGLIFDMPLSSNYTKTETAGSQVMIDRTPYSYNGQNYGATIESDSASFDGVNDYIRFGTGATFFPLPTFSMCAWAKSPGLASGMSTNGIISITYGLTFNLNSLGQFWTRMDNGSGLINVVDTSGTYYDNNFHNYCLTYDGTNRHMYVDGDLKKSAATTWLGTTRWPTNAADIGHENNNPPVQKFNGSIAGVKIYNRALSADEIEILYDKGI